MSAFKGPGRALGSGELVHHRKIRETSSIVSTKGRDKPFYMVTDFPDDLDDFVVTDESDYSDNEHKKNKKRKRRSKKVKQSNKSSSKKITKKKAACEEKPGGKGPAANLFPRRTEMPRGVFFIPEGKTDLTEKEVEEFLAGVPQDFSPNTPLDYIHESDAADHDGYEGMDEAEDEAA